MRRIDGDTLVGLGLHPAIRDPSAGKDDLMNMAAFNDCNLEFALKRSIADPFPDCLILHRSVSRRVLQRGAGLAIRNHECSGGADLGS